MTSLFIFENILNDELESKSIWLKWLHTYKNETLQYKEIFRSFILFCELCSPIHRVDIDRGSEPEI